MNTRTLYKLNSILISLLFLATIVTSLIVGVIEKDKSASKAENRSLNIFPPFELRGGSIKRFPKLFDDYYSDHFGGREWLTAIYNRAKYNMGDSPSIDVTFGKDGWFFLGSIKKGYNRYHNPMADARNIDLYSEEELKKIEAYIVTVKQWLNAQGIEYLFVLTPNKHTIYEEYLPDYIKKVNPQSSSDQLVDHLKRHTDVTLLDLRQSLLDSKPEHCLYNITGTHWNHYAANIAQYEIFQTIEGVYPNAVKPRLFPLRKGINRSGGDLAILIGIREFEELAPHPVFKNVCKPVKHPKDAKETDTYTVTCNGPTLSALVFRDSFFNLLQPYFSRQLKQTTYVWGTLDFSTLKRFVETEKPDLVMEGMVERKLPYIPSPIPELNLTYEGLSQSAVKSLEVRD